MTTMNFKPRFLTAPEYVRALHNASDSVAVLVRNRKQQRTTQRIAPAETVANERFQTWLAEQNAGGADIFIGMNPVGPSSRYRTKENIREVRHLYLDLDEDAGASLQAIRSSGDIPAPNFVLDTSPGKNQVIWRVEGFDVAEAEQVLRALASNYGGDPAATDISRLLRVPGFNNHKYSDSFVVRAHHEAETMYRPADFRSQEDYPESPRHPSDSLSRRTLQPGHKSQSEADWAYAKRALARGDDSEQIIQRIADYRAEDKADPQYYARLTVTKAQLTNKQATGDHVVERCAVPLTDRDI
jgi:hypothetical protein